jgi:hypothetical protein
MRHPRPLLPVLVATLLAACAGPQHFEAAKQLRRNTGEARVLVMPADVELSELTAGGILEPKADWTEAARGYLTSALREEEGTRRIQVIDYDEKAVPAERQDEIHQLAKLYGTVGRAIFVHQFGGPLQLPTKAKAFDWSLGPAARVLHDQYGADYALLTYVRDSYASSGRKALILLAAAANISLAPGQQIAFTSLVDLETGDIVWFNRIVKVGYTAADIREADGARGTVKQLLAGFPQ